MNPTLPILALLGLAPWATAQDPKPVTSGLQRARALFDKVDLDDDGLISAAEAGRSRIPGEQFVAHDDDRDRQLTREEFTLFYRDLLVGARRPVPQDLAAEVSRVEAARRARKAEEQRRQTARPADGPEVGEGTDPRAEAERVAAARKQAEAERIRKAREDANAQREERHQEARPEAEEEEPIEAPTPAPTEAERVAAARAKAEAERISNAREKAEADRIAAAREPKPVAVGGGPAEVRRERPGPGATPEERAVAYVGRLVDGGRLTPAQARDYYAFLTSPQNGAEVAADQVAELRAAHTRAKNRISDLVIAGALSAEEGRQLAHAVDERARAMLPARDPGTGTPPRPQEPVVNTVREKAPVRGPTPVREGATPPERGDATPPERGTTPPPVRREGGEQGAGGNGSRPGKRGKDEPDRDAGGAGRGKDGAGARRRDG